MSAVIVWILQIDIKEKLPERKLGFAVKNGTVPSFTTTKFIEILKK